MIKKTVREQLSSIEWNLLSSLTGELSRLKSIPKPSNTEQVAINWMEERIHELQERK